MSRASCSFIHVGRALSCSITSVQPPVHLGIPIESSREHGWFQTAFRVADVASVFSRVVAVGATPVKAPFTAPDGRASVAFIGDPDGNLIELIQRSDGNAGEH
jgi:catechol 2,3-dioxygenase-like lactoylglutathione lyase family enzyme